MPTTTFNTTDGEIRPIKAKTDWILKGTVYAPDQTVKSHPGYAWRVLIRAAPAGRVLKTYSSSGAGITMASASYGKVYITVDASDIPPVARGTLELIEYAGGAHTGDPTDRWRLSFSAD